MEHATAPVETHLDRAFVDSELHRNLGTGSFVQMVEHHTPARDLWKGSDRILYSVTIDVGHQMVEGVGDLRVIHGDVARADLARDFTGVMPTFGQVQVQVSRHAMHVPEWSIGNRHQLPAFDDGVPDQIVVDIRLAAKGRESNRCDIG